MNGNAEGIAVGSGVEGRLGRDSGRGSPECGQEPPRQARGWRGVKGAFDAFVMHAMPALQGSGSERKRARRGQRWWWAAFGMWLAMCTGGPAWGQQQERDSETARKYDQAYWDSVRCTVAAEVKLYLEAYPEGMYVREAHACLDDIAWSKVESCTSEEGLEAYLGEFPEGRHAEDARGCLDDIAWSKVESCTSEKGMKEYLDEFPEGRHVTEAQGCLDDLAWNEVKTCTDTAGVKEYLEQHPRGRHAREANECIARMDRLDGLLTECRAHEQAHRLTVGAGGNALDCYRKLLDEDPGNAIALEGIERIETHYIDKARQALDREQPESARRHLEKLRTITPEHREVETLSVQLAELKQALAERHRRELELGERRREIESLIESGEYEQARSRLAATQKQGFDHKTFPALSRRIEKGLSETARAREREAKVAEVEAAIEEEKFVEAHARLAEAQALGLSDEAHQTLAAAIDAAETTARRTAERDALLAQVDARIEEEDFVAARARLAEARPLGLSDEAHQARAAAIDAAETTARRTAERDALLAQVDARIEEEDFAAARARLAEARPLGLSDEAHQARAAAIDAAETTARRTAERDALLAQVDARIEEEDFAAARARLAEARPLGLSDEAHQARAAAIDAAETTARRTAKRDALLAQVDARIEEEDFAAARARLAEARPLGLPDEDHEARAAAIDAAEAAARAEEVARLLDSCEAHESAGQAGQALACFRQVLALDPENAVAMDGARRLDDLAAWNVSVDEDSVEAYYAFEQRHPGSVFVGLARKKLGELELEYWGTVNSLATPQAYARYLEIYPEGVFVGLARLRAAEE